MRVSLASVRTAAQSALTGVPSYRREAFMLRLERWWPEIRDGLQNLYGERHDIAELAGVLIGRAAAAFAERAEDLHRLDQRRLLAPDWLQQPDMVGYACYTERFAGDLRGVAERTPYLRELGVSYLHLMPLLQPRPGDNDGGYAVADFRCVRPDLGTTEDLRELANTLREQGISLVMDLVLNHVAREHEWARKARAGEAAYRGYFHIYPDRELPDAYEQTLPEVFPDFAPGNFTWDAELAGWVWTTFNSWQWDVNWSNPAVLGEYLDIILFLANLGVEVLRLDAIAFTWKRLGTDCQNQPEVHDLTQVLRALVRVAAPAVAFKAEAIVGPRDLIQYLGTGEHVGRVSDLAYHNSLMVQGWSMIAVGDTELARAALRALPPKPASGTWITYIRCHDDIGWAIDDRDATSVGLNGFLHRRFLADWYAGEVADSWGRGLVFQHNEVTGDKRTSGSAASLIGLEAATNEREIGDALARLYVIQALAYGWGGIPVIWSGDELGMLNDPDWAREPGHEEDNRWANRPRLDWGLAAQRGDLRTSAGKIFQGLAHLARVRAGLPQLHASTEPRVFGQHVDRGLLAILRRHPAGPFLGIYNLTGDWRPFPGMEFEQVGFTAPVDALNGGAPVAIGEDGYFWLPPYAAWWIVDA